MKKFLCLLLFYICLPLPAYGTTGTIVFQGINPMGLLVQGSLSGAQKIKGSWTGTVFHGTLSVSGAVPGGMIEGSGPVTVVTNPAGPDSYEGRAPAIQLAGTLTLGSGVCALVDSGLALKLSIDKNNQATLELGSNRPSTMGCRGRSGLPGPPLLPTSHRETSPILLQ